MFSEESYEYLLETLRELGIDNRCLEKIQEFFNPRIDFIYALFNSVPVLMVEIDTAGKIKSVNRFLEESLGYTALELQGKDLVETLVPEEDQARVRRAIHVCKEGGGSICGKGRNFSKDGSEKLFGWSVVPVCGENGDLRSIVCVGRDLSKVEESEALLRESENKYRQLFEMESDAIFLIENETGRILEVNPSAVDLYGYSRAELLEMDHTQVSAEGSETRRATLQGRTTVPVRYHRKKDGTVFPVEISASHFTRNGKDVHIAAIRDISFRTQVEEERRLFDSRLQLSQKMEAVGSLAGGMAHDFNNILGGIIGYTELAKIGIPESSPVQDDLEAILEAGNRAKEMIRQILEFSRGVETERRPLHLTVVIKEAMKMLRSTIPANIDIRMNLDLTNDIVMADPTQMHQVMVNLVTNSAHAMEERGGILEVELSETKLEAPINSLHPDLHPGPHICLGVKDTGCGVPSEIQARIFDPYFTTKEKGKGTGLGLAVVDGIVRGHEGGIIFESEPCKGTAFYVYLPRLEKAKEPGIREAKQILPTGMERILFVDDEAVLVDIASRILEDLGYKVVGRTSSVEALELFRHDPDRFDLVMTDYMMPNMTGKELVSRLIGIRPALRVILCTGFCDIITEDAAREQGILGLVKKPYTKAELAKAVRRALDGGKENVCFH